MSFKILHDRVAIIRDDKNTEEKTKSGLFVTESAQNPIHFGTVTHVGLGRVSEISKERIELDVAVGDRVFYPRAAGRDFKVDGVDYLLLTSEEIVGVIPND